MKISEIITDKYKLRMPPTVYYDLLADVHEVEEEQESTTKNDLGVEDCVSRAEVLKLMKDNWHTHNGDWAMQESMDDIRALPSVTPQEPTDKCKWIKYDYRTICPKEHIDVDSPYWRIPENRMETLKYCPYCGKEIEVEK